MWSTLSQPALVVRAHWNGAVAASTLADICLATHLRRMPPTTIPHTPPSAFLNAVIRPILTPSTAAAGAWPLARTVANRKKSELSRSVSNTGCKWFEVIPEGPAAAPRLDERKHLMKMSSSNEKASFWASRTDCDKGALGTAGLRLLSVRALIVALSPTVPNFPKSIQPTDRH